MGNGGTITLNGTGGGIYSSGGLNNYGVSLDNCTLISGNGGSSRQVINVTGIWGQRYGGSHHGAYQNAVTVTMNGINPGNSFNFINCTGGSGGGSNFGSILMAACLLQWNIEFHQYYGRIGGYP